MTYKDFLNEIKIISEEKFNEILSYFPDDLRAHDFAFEDMYNFNDANEICTCLFNGLLADFEGAYCDDVNYDAKTVSIEDIQSIEDLDDIINLFSKWTIENVGIIRRDIEAEKRIDDAREERRKLISIISTYDTDKLREIVG